MLLENKSTRCKRCDKVTKHEDQGANLPSTVRWRCAECGYRNLLEVDEPASDKEQLNG
jgi:transposase-like protein